MKCINIHISLVINKIAEMVKTNAFKPTKSEKASSSPNKLSMTDNVEDDTEYDIKEVASKADHSVYDELVASTFIVLNLSDPVDRTYKSSAGLEIIDVVINVKIIDPKGCKRVIVVWGSNANKLHDFFL